jgi:hypothetical protein
MNVEWSAMQKAFRSDIKKDVPGMKVEMIRWHRMPGNQLVPSDHDPG